MRNLEEYRSLRAAGTWKTREAGKRRLTTRKGARAPIELNRRERKIHAEESRCWRFFFPFGFRVGTAVLGSSMFDLGVDLSADQQCQSGDIEPEHQDDNASERAVSLRVRVEETQVDLEPDRSNDPQQNADDGAGGDPVPGRVL